LKLGVVIRLREPSYPVTASCNQTRQPNDTLLTLPCGPSYTPLSRRSEGTSSWTSLEARYLTTSLFPQAARPNVISILILKCALGFSRIVKNARRCSQEREHFTNYRTVSLVNPFPRFVHSERKECFIIVKKKRELFLGFLPMITKFGYVTVIYLDPQFGFGILTKFPFGLLFFIFPFIL
jgi:hypothetical protein